MSGLKVSGKVQITIEQEVDGVKHTLTHVFKKNVLTKNGLKFIARLVKEKTMNLEGKFLDSEGNVTDDPNARVQALEPMIDMYDACIDNTIGYEVEDDSSPADYVDLGSKMQVAGKLIPIIMGRISAEARKN